MDEQLETGVVVGVDGSAAADRAVRYGALEAHRLGVGLTIVHVMPDFVSIAPPTYVVPTELDRDAEAYGRSLLSTAAEAVSLTAPDLRVHRVLRAGRTVPTLVHVAQHACLVSVGHETVPPLQRIVSGAVTLGVAARAHQPVVSVPAGWSPDLATRKVVAGFKSTAHSPELLSAAFAEAAARDAQLVIFHAWALPSVYDDRIVNRTRREEWSAAAGEAIEALLVEHRAQHPDVSVEVRVVHDQAAHALSQELAEADLLLLVRRAHGFPPAAHLGGTARALLGRAPCPVLVLPARAS